MLDQREVKGYKFKALDRRDEQNKILTLTSCRNTFFPRSQLRPFQVFLKAIVMLLQHRDVVCLLPEVSWDGLQLLGTMNCISGIKNECVHGL